MFFQSSLNTFIYQTLEKFSPQIHLSTDYIKRLQQIATNYNRLQNITIDYNRLQQNRTETLEVLGSRNCGHIHVVLKVICDNFS